MWYCWYQLRFSRTFPIHEKHFAYVRYVTWMAVRVQEMKHAHFLGEHGNQLLSESLNFRIFGGQRGLIARHHKVPDFHHELGEFALGLCELQQ